MLLFAVPAHAGQDGLLPTDVTECEAPPKKLMAALKRLRPIGSGEDNRTNFEHVMTKYAPEGITAYGHNLASIYGTDVSKEGLYYLTMILDVPWSTTAEKMCKDSEVTSCDFAAEANEKQDDYSVLIDFKQVGAKTEVRCKWSFG